MKRAIREHWKDFSAIVGLLLLTIVVAGYILSNERLQFPFISPQPYTINAAFSTAQAITPGQGQSVRVSGVQVGLIGGVTLKNGQGIVQLNLDPKYKGLIHTDATALIRPRTGLDDMFIELDPGTSGPIAKPGYTIPVSNTMPVVNLDEFLASLDADSREYLDLLVNGAGQGLQNHGGDQLAQVLERFEPTHQDLARVNGAVAVRGRNLQRLVNSLARLNTALAAKQGQIVQLVDSSENVFRAFASQNKNVSQAIADLPSTLQQTTTTLQEVQQFADQLGPAAKNLLPAVRAIPAANNALTALAIPGAPIVKNQIRPFVIASRPVVRNLRPAAINLAAATPNLSNVFAVLNHFTNMIGYNPGNVEHGYLWWLAWLGHNVRTLFSVQDANGDFRPLFIQASCASLAQIANSSPLNEVLMNLTPILTSTNLCPTQAAADKQAYAKYQQQHPATATASSTPALSNVPALSPHGSNSGGGSKAASSSNTLFLPKLPTN